MPWMIEQGGGECAEAEWAVVNEESGETEGCHETEDDAKAQVAALNLNVEEEGDGEMAGGSFRLDPLILEDEFTEDRRIFSDLGWRDPPLPLMFQSETSAMGGHDGARLAGRITELRKEGNRIVAEGVADLAGEAGREMFRQVEAGNVRGVSADVVGGEVEFIAEDVEAEEVSIIVRGGRIAAATVVPIPAFGETQIVLDDVAGSQVDDEPIAPPPENVVVANENLGAAAPHAGTELARSGRPRATAGELVRRPCPRRADRPHRHRGGPGLRPRRDLGDVSHRHRRRLRDAAALGDRLRLLPNRSDARGRWRRGAKRPDRGRDPQRQARRPSALSP